MYIFVSLKKRESLFIGDVPVSRKKRYGVSCLCWLATDFSRIFALPLSSGYAITKVGNAGTRFLGHGLHTEMLPCPLVGAAG